MGFVLNPITVVKSRYEVSLDSLGPIHLILTGALDSCRSRVSIRQVR